MAGDLKTLTHEIPLDLLKNKCACATSRKRETQKKLSWQPCYRMKTSMTSKASAKNSGPFFEGPVTPSDDEELRKLACSDLLRPRKPTFLHVVEEIKIQI